MKIEGDTIIFKTGIENYEAERSGLKPCTIRLIPEDEWQEIFAFSFYFTTVDYRDSSRRIRITLATDKTVFFERKITCMIVLGQVMNQRLVLICWRHEE